MAPAKRSLSDLVSPERQKLTAMQTQRLASLANVQATELEGLTIAQASERLKWIIDPQLFWFREICGKVVKRDPITGGEYPVPFATVNVQDTECNLISYFPVRSPWTWHFPLFCRRETIATVKTDQCGNFCVWVPRFEIEWILRWRERRLCFPVIFNRPTLKDLIPPLQQTPVRTPGHPDPGSLNALTGFSPSTIEAIAGKAAGQLAEKVSRLQASQSLGALNLLGADLLNRRAFDTELPPPLPPEFQHALGGRAAAAEGASAHDGVRAAVAHKLGLNPAAIATFNPARFMGPFWRCIDIFLPEWQAIFEVPDISFEVTQDINGDGDQQVIYDDPFGTDWTTNNVTLVASSIAVATNACGAPEVPCGDVPAILFAGEMPLDNPAYFNGTTGYVVRVNRPANGDGSVAPVASDLTRPPAQTPFCETVQLFGCVNVEVEGVAAQYYRVLQSFNGGPYAAITGLAWDIFTFPGGTPVAISADAAGWYEVLSNPDDFHPARMVLEWPTPLLGECTLKLEVADGAKNSIGQSAPVPIQVDNTRPSINFTTLSWKFVGAPDSSLTNLLAAPCPIIRRGVIPQDIEVVFAANVMANHLRDSSIGVSGCGGGDFVLETTVPGTETYHWYTSPGDNSVLLNGRFTLAATSLDGCYSFNCEANSRAMNPSGADGGNLIPPDWYEDVVYLYATQSVSVAVISQN
jgi:hypothetical protein